MFLFVLKVVKFLIAIVSLSVTAHFFGVSVEKDMWVLASVVVATVVTSVWGPLNEIFRTKFVFIREQEGDEVARDKTASLVGFVFWFSIILGALIYVFIKPLAAFLSSDVSGDSLLLLTKLAVLLLPTILITELSNISTSILNAYNVFYIPEIVGCITAVLNIILVVLLAPVMGIYSLLLSTYVSVVLLFLVLIYFLRANEIEIWDRIFNFSFSDVWVFIVFSLPYFFPYFISQLNVISQNFMAGMLGEGSISTIDYSNKFAIQIQQVFASILTTVMVPMLAKAFINNNKEHFNSVLKENVKTCYLILCVCLALLVGAAEPVCSFFFATGRVSDEALQSIIVLTRLYGIGLIGVLFYMISSFILLSSDQRKTCATIGVIVQILIFLTYVVTFKLTGSLAVFPIAYGSCHLVAGLVMFFKSQIVEKMPIYMILLRSLLAMGIVIVFVYFLVRLVPYSRPIWGLIIAGCGIVAISPVILWGNDMSFKRLLLVVKGKIDIRKRKV